VNLLGNLVKNVGRRPATRLYPAETREMFDGVRGRLEMKVETCTFCTLCAKRCPSDAIVVTREPRTWTLDPYACILCGACVDVCPKDCLTLEKDYRKPGE
jgi:ech hydrogenase subunit F